MSRSSGDARAAQRPPRRCDGARFTRRTLLGAASATALAATGTALSRPLSAAAATPGAADWAALARRLDGRLLHPGDDGYLSALRTFDPRRDGKRPLAIVRVAGAGDVAAALQFTTRFDLKPRPRSGGHSYVGASTGNGVLVIDCGPIDSVHYDGDSRTVSVGAGVRLGDLHAVLDAHHRTVPTGSCPTVGAAGLTLGGGVGTETRLHGLTADALIGATVVTADGSIRTVDRSHHSDLFWALRGGGGGNFGVVTRLRFRTFPAVAGEIFRLSWSPSQAHRVLTGWQHRLAEQPRHVWANLHLDSAGGTVTPSITGVCWGSSASAEIRALVSAVGRAPSTRRIWPESHAGAMSWFAGGSAGRTRQSWYAGSDVLGGKLYGTRADAVLHAVGSWNGAGSVAAIFDPFGGAVTDVAASATAFRWRTARADVQWYVGLSSTSSTNLDRAAAWVARCHRAIGDVSVGGYVNYLEPGRPVADYYGANYDRLVRINRTYDPHGVFDSRYSLPG